MVSTISGTPHRISNIRYIAKISAVLEYRYWYYRSYIIWDTIELETIFAIHIGISQYLKYKSPRKNLLFIGIRDSSQGDKICFSVWTFLESRNIRMRVNTSTGHFLARPFSSLTWLISVLIILYIHFMHLSSAHSTAPFSHGLHHLLYIRIASPKNLESKVTRAFAQG